MDAPEPRIGHHLLRQQEVRRKQPALQHQQPVLGLDRLTAQDLRVIRRQRHRRLQQRPKPLLEGHHRMIHVIDRTRCDVHEVDVSLVQHVRKLAEHATVRKVLRNDVPTFLQQVAGRNNLEQRRMLLEHRIMIGKHRAPQPHQGYSDRRTLIFSFHHFLTISVMADRNCATSLN